MTTNQLYKELKKLVEAGHGRKELCISKTTFTHPLEEDGVTILPVDSVDLHVYPLADEDGGTQYNRKGEECTRFSVVLFGENRAPEGTHA